MDLGRVAELWSYPVKSFAGVSVNELVLSADGPVGDRAWGVADQANELVLSAKRVGELLDATVSGDIVTLPTGATGRLGDPRLDAALTKWLGRTVRFVHVAAAPSLRIEMHHDNERDTSPLVRWRTPRGRYVDLFPLHLLSTGSLRRLEAEHPALDWSVRRFRPNIVIDTDVPEAEWLGHGIRLGAVELFVPRKLTERCVMVNRGQSGTLRAIAQSRGEEGPLTVGSARAVLGCYGEVTRPGAVRVADAVTLVS